MAIGKERGDPSCSEERQAIRGVLHHQSQQHRHQVWEGGVYHPTFLPLPILLLLAKARAQGQQAQARPLDLGDLLRPPVQRGGGVVGRHRLQASQEEEEWGWVNRGSHGRVGTMRVNANVQQARGQVYNQDEDRSMPVYHLTLYTRIPTPMPHLHPHPQPPLFLPLPQPRPILIHNRSRCILPQRKHV